MASFSNDRGNVAFLQEYPSPNALRYQWNAAA